jgi:predicted dehydrogenase
MQRSGEHFQEAVKVIQNGGIGQVTQILVTHGTGGSLDRKPDSTPRPVPDGFDWEMWQGPAPRHPYTPSRARSWRNYYDYGGGGVTDWGIHHIDIVHMALDPQGTKAPLFVAASCNYSGLKDPDRDAVPGTWAITFQYEDFVMVLQSCTPPTPDRLIQGPMFWGTRGLLLVNRGGYYVKPPSAYAGMMTTKFGRGTASRSAAEAKEVIHEDFQPLERGWEAAHVRNFLDCVKSRQKPLNDLETAFNGHLACLLASQSMKEGRALRWDPKSKTAGPA